MSDELTHIGQQIENLTRLTSVNLLADIQQTPFRQRPVAVLPSGTTLADLTAYLPQPVRHKAEFTTNSVEAFMQYATGTDISDRARVFVKHARENDNNLRAMMYFDFGNDGNPSWRSNVARLTLGYTEEGRQVSKYETGGVFSQRGLAEWIEDWMPFLACYNHDEPLDIKAAIQAARNVKIEARGNHDSSDGELRASRSSFEEVEAKAKDGLLLPTRVVFKCTPYPELDQYEFPFRVGVNTHPDATDNRFKLFPIRHDSVHEQIRKDFQRRIVDEFAEAALSHVPVIVGWAKE